MGEGGEGGGEGAGFEVVGVEAEVGGQLLGAVFAAVGGGVGGVGKGQAVGIVAGVLIERAGYRGDGVGGGVVHADDVALVVGDVGMEIVIGGDVTLGELVALELVVFKQIGADVIAAAQSVAGGGDDGLAQLFAGGGVEPVNPGTVGKGGAAWQIEDVVLHVDDVAAQVARLVAVGVVGEGAGGVHAGGNVHRGFEQHLECVVAQCVQLIAMYSFACHMQLLVVLSKDSNSFRLFRHPVPKIPHGRAISR